MDTGLLEGIRTAVACGEFDKALVLWNEYVARLEQDVSQGRRLSEEEFRKAGELVSWSRQVALCARTRAMDQLDSLRVARQYEAPGYTPTPHMVLVNL